ncbi:MAG TPA: carboxypeptidase regulatory-like domain-containing protein, partial [Polyangiales bacterium]
MRVAQLALLSSLLSSQLVACSASAPKATHGNVSNSAGSGTGAGSGGSSGFGGGSTIVGTPAGTGAGGSGRVCAGLQCAVHSCSSGTTSISGKVYDPAGKNPLYNIVVYVPNEPVAPLKAGASCDACADLYSGKPVAVALTDGTGAFTIKNAPDGANIPLVVQVGKWRMQTKVANVVRCQDNPQPDKSLRLPKNHTEGDIPNIAISTGGADTLECLLARIGVDKAEY